MDSSKPPNSHPGPHSRSRTGSGSRDGSSVGSEPDLGGSIRASASSVGNNEPELPPRGGDSSKCQGKKISTGDEPKEDQDANIANQCTPKKRDQSEPSKGKEKVENTTDREEEITLLESIVDYYDEKGTFPFVGLNLERKFSINWIQEHGVLADTLVLDFKILELHARFLLNELNELDCDGDVVGAMDPIDLKIYQLSNRIWGKKDNEDHNNSVEEKTADDHGGVNPNDSEGKSVGGVNPKSSEDSCEGETDDESDTEDSKSKLTETSDVSDSKDSKTSSSEDLAESETDAKHSSSTASKNSSETETNDDQIDHDGSEHIRLDSKASSSSFLEQNPNAEKEQSTRNQQAIEEADDGVHLLSISLMSAGIGVVIMIILALIMAIREI